MTELFLDGHRIEIKPGQIRQNFQNNNLGDVKDRQLNFTNTFKAYNTTRNETFFKYLEELNTVSAKPYRYMDSKIVEDGLEINIGTAIIRKSNNEYVEIYIYSGINSLYERINNKSIRDLDWSDLNHTLTFQIATDSFDGSLGYVYAVSNQTTEENSDRLGYLENWLPSVFEHVIFDKIITEAGFTYEGELFDTDEFKAQVINPVEFDDELPDLLVRDFGVFMPDISQRDFLKEILFRYGLMFKKERNEDKYVFKQVKDIFRNRADAVDWSSKFVTEKDKKYDLGNYGRKNYIRYSDYDGYNYSADGFFTLDVDYLDETKTIAQSKYEAIFKLDKKAVIQLPIFDIDPDTNEIKANTISPSISRLADIGGVLQLDSDGGQGPLYNGAKPYLRFENLNFSRYVLENYYELQKIADRAKIVTVELYLDPIDIYNLDFFKLVWIKYYSSFFYINKISNYQEGKVCSAELVRIPPNVFSGAENVNTAPVVELIPEALTVNEDQELLFTLNVTDAENNIESWLLTFGDGTSESGFGNPPATISHQFQLTGPRPVELTVRDFEGLSGSDSVVIQVNEVLLTSFDPATGIYTAPPGSTVTIDITVQGQGAANSELKAGTSAGLQNLLLLRHSLNQFDTQAPKQGAFIVPANGTVYITATQTTTGVGPVVTNMTIENNGEIISRLFGSSDPIPQS